MTGNEFDVLVIGEGLSGITAASAAASQGLHVMLASMGPGTFVLGTGCVDLEGLDADHLGLAECGPDKMEEAITFFVELSATAGCAYQGGIRERRLIPTIMGTFQTVSLAPHSLWKGDPRGVTRVVVAGIDTLPGFDADFVAERLSFHSRQMNLDTSYRSAVLKLPENHVHALTTVEVATRVDRDPAYRDALVAALKSVVGDAELLIIPGILGMKSGDDDISRLEENIGCAICELPTMPPSVPGMRLLQRFESHLIELGAEICTGFPVQKLCLEKDQCTGIVLDTPGRARRIYADSLVLASGKFSHLLEDRTLNANPPWRATQVNQDLQPVNSEGSVVARNLFECGSVLEKSIPRHGNAIAILTGFQAGMLASKQGVHYAGR